MTPWADGPLLLIEKELMETITLTGRVLEWDNEPTELVIRPDQRVHYEERGYTVRQGLGWLIASQPQLDPRDGDIELQSKSDWEGRMAAAGGHANYGYSGYFKGYVLLKGKRKVFLDFWTMFPEDEHHYAAQKDRPEVIEAIRGIVDHYAGRPLTKTKGGYALDVDYKVKASGVLV